MCDVSVIIFLPLTPLSIFITIEHLIYPLRKRNQQEFDLKK